MILNEAEVVAAIERLSAECLRSWVESGWVRPRIHAGMTVFTEVDIARVRLLCELRDDLAMEEDSLPVVLSLVDQIHGLRRELRNLGRAIEAQPREVQEQITRAFRMLSSEETAVAIHAECHTVDNRLVVEFDATPWFEEADPDSIVLLARRDWIAPWVADALESRSEYAPLHHLLRYARERLKRESLEDPAWGNFECRVNGTEALAWLVAKRPEVARKLGVR
jgi:hypothetical protein